MRRGWLALALVSACHLPGGVTVVPTITYGERLGGNGANQAMISLSFVDTYPADVSRYDFIGSNGAVSPITRPGYGPMPMPDEGEDDTPGGDGSTTISGSWGSMKISQEVMKYLIGPLGIGAWLFYRRRRESVPEVTQ